MYTKDKKNPLSLGHGRTAPFVADGTDRWLEWVWHDRRGNVGLWAEFRPESSRDRFGQMFARHEPDSTVQQIFIAKPIIASERIPCCQETLIDPL